MTAEDNAENTVPERPEGIVVGVDGSEHGDCALSWAIKEAQSRQAVLNLVTAYSIPIFAASGLDGGFATVDDEAIRQGAEAVQNEAVEKVKTEGTDYKAWVENGDASSVLVDYSESADLMVIGTRGRGGFMGRLLGSVSSSLPAHSKAPTVVVPKICAPRLEEPKGGARSPESEQQLSEVQPLVTVGADGSDQARYAVLVAAEQAQRSGKAVKILCAVPPYTAAMAWLPAPLDRDALFGEIQEQLVAGKAWLESYYPGLEVQLEVVDGNPIEKLVEASRTSELLVLGTRGHGGFAGMILGSTTDGVLHHAKGPVMVVRDQEDPRLQERSKFGPVLQNI